MWPGPRPTCMLSFILIRLTVWPQCTNVTDRQTVRQRTDSIGRTVLQTVAQEWVTGKCRTAKFIQSFKQTAEKQVYDFQLLTISATLSCLRLFLWVPHTFLSSPRSGNKWPLVAFKSARLEQLGDMLIFFKGLRLFSERVELTFTFAICYRPSVCLSSVCRLSVTFVRPTQAIEMFGNIFYGIRYLGHPLTSTKNFTEIVPGEPLRRGS